MASSGGSTLTMCGIAGKFSFAPDSPLPSRVIGRMTSTLVHRGPDAEGYYTGEGIALGHRRLSIIDLATGQQPLANEDGSVLVVFNGEIYNFRDLRAELESRGHVFRTESDTEVLVHGYEEWATSVVDHLRGMFAFAIWDARLRRLVLARDRLGIKPLYYAVTGPGGISFASEIKALLEDPEVSRAWRPEAIDHYLTLQYVPSPGTVYRQIQRLLPAHVLVAANGRIEIRRYWDLVFTGDGDPAREDEYLERLDSLLRDAVRLRLISDVPLGAFLSGGIDSSAVASYMAETSNSPVVAISVGFEDGWYNEAAYAREVAGHLGCRHVPRMVTPDVASLLPKLAWHFDEPFSDASAVPTYYVSEAARQHVTVALSGDGGDEIWAGYARHAVERWQERARRLLGPWGSIAAGTIGNALPLSLKGARALRYLRMPRALACAEKHAYGLFDRYARRSLLDPEFARTTAGTDAFATFIDAWQRCPSPDPLDRALYVDVNTYLVDDILTKVDKASMAVSLETRVPLLDHRLLEFAATVPFSLKLRGKTRKYLLRRLLTGRLPRSVVERPKHGFEAPTGEWLRGPLKDMAGDVLHAQRFRERGIFNPRGVDRLWSEHQLGVEDHRHRLWSLLMLELWFEQFIDPAAPMTSHAGTEAARPAAGGRAGEVAGAGESWDTDVRTGRNR